jgi:hypothetical protein
MPDLITLTCPTCGAKLKLGQDIHLVYCTSCGNEHLVQRGDGSIYLAPMAANVAQIRTGVDKTAAELAIVRIEKELQTAVQEHDEIENTVRQLARNKADAITNNGCATLFYIAVAALSLVGFWVLVGHTAPAILLKGGRETMTAVICALSFIAFSGIVVAHHRSAKTNEQRRSAELQDAELAVMVHANELVAKQAHLRQTRQIANS